MTEPYDLGESPALTEEETKVIREDLSKRQKVYCDLCERELTVPAGFCYTCPHCGYNKGVCG